MKTAGSLTLEELTARSKGTLVDHLGIEFTAIGPTSASARMPVDERTTQPLGLLHGGATAALAESLGSSLSALNIDLERQMTVGLEINVNHLRGVRSGYVYATAKPVHLGRKTHVLEIEVTNEAGKRVAVSRLTMMILDQSSPDS